MSLSAPPAPMPRRRCPLANSSRLLALLFATVAFSIDAMLPLLGVMGRELSRPPGARAAGDHRLRSRAGAGHLHVGADVRPVRAQAGDPGGIALYMVAATVAALSTASRCCWPRASSRGLARPRRAWPPGAGARPLCRAAHGAGDVLRHGGLRAGAGGGAADRRLYRRGFGWRAIFWSFLIFGLVSGSWLLLRQPETLPPAAAARWRRPPLGRAARGRWATPASWLYLAALSLALRRCSPGSPASPLVFEQTYGRDRNFPTGSP
jgi:MFS transporter, DHA1 family, multidrug resistance protein